MNTVVLATNNRHKVQEIRAVLADLPLTFLSLKDFPDLPEVREDGKTCEENARKKARETAVMTTSWALADDTGLEVTALHGQPGVYAARYAGETATYKDNCEKLLEELKNVPAGQRGARFLTVMALADPTGRVETVEGELQGTITEQFYGSQGFGYDPVFFVDSVNRTLAELSLSEKNELSHRGIALRRAKDLLQRRMVSTPSVGA